LGRDWEVRDDTVNPFGDPRGEGFEVYTFDLTKDMLIFSNALENRKIPFAFFMYYVLTPAKFTAFNVPPSPRIIDISAFVPPYWQPNFPVAERVFTLVERIFSDFNFQWRHVLRCAYADTTFRKLARAVLSIAVLDFNVVEISGNMGTCANHSGRPYVSNIHLPSWEPFLESTFNLGRTMVVLNQDLENALAWTRKHSREQLILQEKYRPNIYLLLSIRHIMLCRVDRHSNLSYTSSIPFLNGIDTPSSASITLIIQAFALAFPPPPHTPIHDLPIEMQNRILEAVSNGPIEAARLGALLGLGSPFTWMRAQDSPRSGGAIERHMRFAQRHDTSPIESEIHFEETFSGLAYK
jgi:hypothetical protein